MRLARWLFYLPYHYARMFLEHESIRRPTSRARFSTRGRGSWPGPVPASYCDSGPGRRPYRTGETRVPRTFLGRTVHPVRLRKSRLYQGRVHHTPYPLQPAKVLSLDETLLAARGSTAPTRSAGPFRRKGSTSKFIRCDVRESVLPESTPRRRAASSFQHRGYLPQKLAPRTVRFRHLGDFVGD